jgi:ribose/xylose/arabinose/galactoside ABC-type transport system permease subunit
MAASIALSARPSAGSRLKRLVFSQEGILLIAIIALFLAVGAYNQRFLSANNLSSIFLGNAYIAVAAIGMSMVIVSGNIDVSVGSLIGVLAVVSGTLAVSGWPLWVAWTAPILVGMAVSAVNGWLVAYMRVPSIVVTLGMLSILKGGLISVTAGAWINNLPDGYQLAQLRPLGVPLAVWFMIVLTALAAFWMYYSGFGRAIYAVGGNAEAARLAGIDRRRTVFIVFIIHGFFAGIASILFATQLSVIQSTVPSNLELTIITASVVGGVSILGGIGTVIGSTLAAILIAAIASSLVFLNVSPYWIRAVQGVLILITVLADLWRRSRQALR